MNDLKIYFNKVMLCNMKDLQWIPLFPLFLWMYRRLSLDCFDSEDIFNTPWFSGSFCSYKLSFLKGLIDVYSYLWWTEMHGSWAQLWRSPRSLSRLGFCSCKFPATRYCDCRKGSVGHWVRNQTRSEYRCQGSFTCLILLVCVQLLKSCASKRVCRMLLAVWAFRILTQNAAIRR